MPNTNTLAREQAIGLVQMASMLGISEPTARRIAQRGDIPGLRRIGGQWRIMPSDVLAYMKSA